MGVYFLVKYAPFNVWLGEKTLGAVVGESGERPARLGGAKAWLVCLSAALFFFYEFIQMHMFNAINDELRLAFHADASQLSFLSSTYLWADVLFLLPAGILLDRLSTRHIILMAMAICIIGTLGFALSTNFASAAFFHFLSGIGNAFCFLSCIMLVSRWFPPHRQAFVIGLVVTMAFIGGMVAQTPLASLAHYYGWRHALMQDTVLGVLIMLCIFTFVQDQPQGCFERSDDNGISFAQGMKRVLANAQNWLAGIYTCMLNLPIMVLCALWGMKYLHKVHHILPMQGSLVISMIFIGAIIGSPLAGWLSDKVRLRRMPMIIGATLSLAVIAVILSFDPLSYSQLLVLFFALGLFTSTQVIAYPMVAESNPAELTGTATGLASVLIMGGAGVAQVLFGYLMDSRWNHVLDNGVRVYDASCYSYAMTLFPVAFAIALIAILLTKETHCRQKEA